MPATSAQLAIDLEQLLQRALSRCDTGAWIGALEAINRAGQLLPALIAQLPAGDPRLQRSASLLDTLRHRFHQAQATTRQELDQLLAARARLNPTRHAYAPTASDNPRQRFAESA